MVSFEDIFVINVEKNDILNLRINGDDEFRDLTLFIRKSFKNCYML